MEKNTSEQYEKVVYEAHKALFKKIQKDTVEAGKGLLLKQLYSAHPGFISRVNHRPMLLLWGFVRGFKFRRIERTHHMQGIFEHNMPNPNFLVKVWKHYLPEIEESVIKTWVHDATGAIPAPPPRVKKPYVRPAASAAE